jgi:DNA-binding response OmpR family regulator
MAKILCIEDEVELREIITEVLEEAGYDVCVANDGDKGLEMIHYHKPDLVLCDINMPQKDGYEVLKEIRDNHLIFADMPFIFLSALADKELVLVGMNTGADAYLTKPINYEVLLSTIQASLRQMARIKQKHEDVITVDM